MVEKRIDVVVTDKGAVETRKRIVGIGTAADKSATSVERLQKQLKSSGPVLARLVNAEARLLNAKSRSSALNTRIETQTLRQQSINERLAKQKQQTSAAAKRADLAALKVTNANTIASQRAHLAAVQLGKAKTQAALASRRLANDQSRLNTVTRRTSGSFLRIAKRVLIFASFSLIARNVVELADAFTLLQNKLKNVADTLPQVLSLTEAVFQVAQRSRSNILATAQAFQRFDIALKQLGASQQESLRLTETVNKLIISSGATAGEASSALLQLSQAFNKGKLDGDEFRSVMELMPPVAQALADELGVARGELLNLAPQGIITSQVMRAALAKVADDADNKFSKLNITIGQSLTKLGNSFIVMLGRFDKAVGITKTLATAFNFLADNIGVVTIAISAFGVAVALAFAPQIAAGITFVTLALVNFSAVLFATPIGAFITLVTVAGVGIFALGKAFGFFGDQVRPQVENLRGVNKELERTSKLRAGLEKQGIDAETSKKLIELQDLKASLEGATGSAIIFSADDAALKTKLSEIAERFASITAEIKKLKAAQLEDVFDTTAAELTNEIQLLQVDKEQRAELRRELEAELELKKKGISIEGDLKDAFSDTLRQLNLLSTVRDQLNEKDEAYQAILEGTEGKVKKLRIEIEAYSRALHNQKITQVSAANGIRDINKELRSDRLESGQGTLADALTAGLDDVVGEYKNVMAELSQLFGDFFNRLTKGFADATARAIVFGEDFGDAMKRLARDALAEVISQLIQIAIQTLINRAIEEGSSTSPGAQAGVFAATVIKDTSKNKQGPSSGRRSAPTVRGRESFNKAQVQRVGTAQANINVKIENNAPGVVHEVQQVGPNEMRIIAREEVARTTPTVVAAQLQRPSSRVSQGIQSNFETGRRR